MSDDFKKITTRKQGDPRQDEDLKLPKCPSCSKDPFSCECGEFEDLKK